MSNCILCGSNAVINEQEIASRIIYNCPNCGVFVVSDLVEKEVVNKKNEIKALLMSRKIAQKSDIVLISFEKAKLDKDYLQLTVDQIVGMFPESFTHQMNMALENLGNMSQFAGYEIKIDDVRMSPYFYVRRESVEALNFVIKSMLKADLIEVNYYSGTYFPCGVTVSAKGWDKLHKLHTGKKEHKAIFASAPRTESDISHQFTKALQKAGHECGLQILQNLDVHASPKISNELIAGVKSSYVIVCDFSEQSAEAYYAAALAQGLGKICIMTCHESMRKKLQIDTGQLSVLFWEKQDALFLELLSAIRAKI